MIPEAIAAAESVVRALLWWIVAAAALATAALYAVVVAAVCAVLAVRRGVRAVLSLVQHSSGGEVVREAPGSTGARTEPHAPSWARKDAAWPTSRTACSSPGPAIGLTRN